MSMPDVGRAVLQDKCAPHRSPPARQPDGCLPEHGRRWQFSGGELHGPTAPRDGTAIALIARDAPLGPITGNPGAQFDPTKFSWLGTTTVETNICMAYPRSRSPRPGSI
jgi:hypothetical protein